jgi:hypothetical protein
VTDTERLALCSIRCRNARSATSSCRCRCGGHNHRLGHLEAFLRLPLMDDAWHVELERARAEVATDHQAIRAELDTLRRLLAERPWS